MSREPRGLGKGLGALFSESPVLDESQEKAAAHTLPVQALEPNPNQPRRDFNGEALEDLAESIRQHGLQVLSLRS